uniref:Ig-like domain-containing protein n=1 Tax=Cyprinus carpio TaxID=7962 RepID=A0A8C1XLI2_CYPCA
MRFPSFCFCLFLSMLHFTDGCHVSGYGEHKEVTGYTGGSVLLPCSCTHPQSTVKTFSWLCLKGNPWPEVFQDDKYKNRLKLFNDSSPANLSLLISDLRKKDEGFYRCKASQTYTDINLIIQEPQIHTIHTTNEPIKQTEEPTTKLNLEKQFLILLAVLPVVLLLAVLALIYWRFRGRRDVQKTTNDGLVLCTENEKQGEVNPESLTQGENLNPDENVDEVTYSSIVHIKTDTKPAHKQIVMAEHSEYASIK